MERETAARFSFLLGLPAITLAGYRLLFGVAIVGAVLGGYLSN